MDFQVEIEARVLIPDPDEPMPNKDG